MKFLWKTINVQYSQLGNSTGDVLGELGEVLATAAHHGSRARAHLRAMADGNAAVFIIHWETWEKELSLYVVKEDSLMLKNIALNVLGRYA